MGLPRSNDGEARFSAYVEGLTSARKASSNPSNNREAAWPGPHARSTHRDYWLADSRPKEWLLIEWPDGENEPIKYWLSTLPEDVAKS